MKNLPTTETAETRKQWATRQKQQRLQISQLSTRQDALRTAGMVALLEVASAKIDRFGWDRMDENIKAEICGDWCDTLRGYTLAEIKSGIKMVFEDAKGKLRSINEHQVEAAIRKSQARTVAAMSKERPAERDNPKPTRESQERMADLVKDLGFVKPMPKVGENE